MKRVELASMMVVLMVVGRVVLRVATKDGSEDLKDIQKVEMLDCPQ